MYKCIECGSLCSSENVSADGVILCSDCDDLQNYTKEVFGTPAFIEDDYRTAEEVIYGTI